MEEKKKEEEKSIIGLIVFAFCFVLAMWILTLAIIPNIDYFKDWNDRGTFGDMFGAVNALFSGLAFAGVIIAILLQKQELKLQRLELEQTRDELRGQKEQLALQNKTFKLQQFENTFFNMVKLHNDIVDGIKIVNTHNENPTHESFLYGRVCFQMLFDELKTLHNRKSSPRDDQGSNFKANKEAYSDFYNKYNNTIRHYFNNIKIIIEFIDKNNIEKDFYINIIKAQLSIYESDHIHYYIQSDYCPSEFKYLIEKYKVIPNNPYHLLI